MKKRLLPIFLGIICISLVTITFYKAIPKNMKIGILLANVEALADFNESGELLIKGCYTVFSGRIGADVYYTCDEVSSNPNKIYPCGTLVDEIPTWGFTQSNQCYTYP